MARLSLLALCTSLAAGASLSRRQSSDNTATVDLSTHRGSPEQLASGFIYGVPIDQGQIPSQFYSDIGWNYGRFGGGQIKPGGWIQGQQGYEARFASLKSNYQTARSFGASVFTLVSDLWGQDTANSDTYWPGDNGVWTQYDEFLDQALGDLVSNNMLGGMQWEVWNEPDNYAWIRSQDQYLAMWNRTVHRIRSDSSLNGLGISGPSTGGGVGPQASNTWWQAYMQWIVETNTIPDQYTWHAEPGDLRDEVPGLYQLQSTYGAPSRPININEYAAFDNQNPAGDAWWISRLERYNARGCRANWLGECQLYDFMASLLGKSNTSDCDGTGYYPNGGWQLYKYYNQNMTGVRATTQTSGDGNIDVFTVIGSNTVRTLTGVLDMQGTWYVEIGNLTSVGLPAEGNLVIQTWGFPDEGHFGEVTAPINYGTYGHDYAGNSVTFPVFQTSSDQNTAWAFEFAKGSAEDWSVAGASQ